MPIPKFATPSLALLPPLFIRESTPTLITEEPTTSATASKAPPPGIADNAPVTKLIG
jgi:hypothetical protein